MNGLLGRQSGTTPGYSYSTANKNMAVHWEENTLYDYLLNPKKVFNMRYLSYVIGRVEIVCYKKILLVCRVLPALFVRQDVLHLSYCA